MKILVTSTGPTLDSPVDMRFGRCAYFILVDPETMEYEAISNPYAQAPGGAGIQTAQMALQTGASAIITGSVGPNASGVLGTTGIRVFESPNVSVEEAVRMYKENKLQPLTVGGGFVPGGFGMGAGFGGGYGRGGGFGRGYGRGGGFGRGGGYGGYGAYGGFGPGYNQWTPPQMNPAEELQILRTQAEMLKRQLDAIERRIRELENSG